MKITRSQLKRIIKEEMQRSLLTEEIKIETDYPNIMKYIIVPIQTAITDNERYGIPNWKNGHQGETLKFEIPDSVWPKSDVEEIFADEDNYPNGLELTIDPPHANVSIDNLKEYVGKYSEAADELKTFARSLANAGLGSRQFEITKDVEYDSGDLDFDVDTGA